LPITAPSAALGCIAFMKAAFGLRFAAVFFLAAGFFAATFFTAGFFAAAFFAAGFLAAVFLAAGFAFVTALRVADFFFVAICDASFLRTKMNPLFTAALSYSQSALAATRGC
jgi:hypothetical protein